MRHVTGRGGDQVPDREYVACVQQDGRTYRSRPHPDREAVERIAAEAGGWVEQVIAVPEWARPTAGVGAPRPAYLSRAS